MHHPHLDPTAHDAYGLLPGGTEAAQVSEAEFQRAISDAVRRVEEAIAGHHRPTKTRFLDAAKQIIDTVCGTLALAFKRQHARQLRHGLQNQYAGQYGYVNASYTTHPNPRHQMCLGSKKVWQTLKN